MTILPRLSFHLNFSLSLFFRAFDGQDLLVSISRRLKLQKTEDFVFLGPVLYSSENQTSGKLGPPSPGYQGAPPSVNWKSPPRVKLGPLSPGIRGLFLVARARLIYDLLCKFFEAFISLIFKIFLGFKDEFQSSCIRGLACEPHGGSKRCCGFLWSSWVKRIRLVELFEHFVRLLDYYLWVWRQRYLATPPSVIGSFRKKALETRL